MFTPEPSVRVAVRAARLVVTFVAGGCVTVMALTNTLLAGASSVTVSHVPAAYVASALQFGDPNAPALTVKAGPKVVKLNGCPTSCELLAAACLQTFNCAGGVAF